MTQREYDAETANALFEMAFPGWEVPPYVVHDDGIYPSDEHRDLCPPGTTFDWTPAYDMDWPGGPNPANAPMLPIPFTAGQLAACMLDGAGSSIQEFVGRRLGYALGADDLVGVADRQRWVRDALCEAYALAAHAQESVGEFDHQSAEASCRLRHQYVNANRVANKREGVFESGIDPEETRFRRARAVNSVVELKAQAEEVQAKSDADWKAWRRAMVQALLDNGSFALDTVRGTGHQNAAATDPAGSLPCQATPGWSVRKLKKQSGYTSALLRLLKDLHAEGQPRPTAREVIELWRKQRPPEIQKVMKDGVDYYNAHGDTKTANLRTITQTIQRLTERHRA